MAGEFRFPGSSGHPDGQYCFINPMAPSTLLVLRVSFNLPSLAQRLICSSLHRKIQRRSWRNMRGITGYAEMPPLWSFGYQQSHRTLASREEVLAEAKTFREKKLPCDALIYLGTGFCPSGWNTENGSFAWNSRVFPDPKEMFDRAAQRQFSCCSACGDSCDELRGTVHDPCKLSRFDEESGVAIGMLIAKISPWVSTDGGPMKATRSTLHHAWSAIACTGKVRRSIDRMSVPTRCIATVTPACNATRRSFGLAMCSPPGKR